MTIHNNFSRVIRKLRKSKGIRQYVLSEKIGIAKSYLSELENGKRKISFSVLERISKAFGIPVSIIIFLATDFDDVNGFDEELYNEMSSLINDLIF